ncbi:Rhodanese-related sulfurtransferase [Succinivibrio dextrinosolvens]|uniref:rhodanese-like domain-containing protein n=1 Tax=Succinivibrio dextrinosolvens TaxID=83771 RepID=UPI0008EECC0C|nr:rhodanese-like domain-containing protein [Succinivibrio dextrinosolvens]SFS58345.1 Rhodanese-related sulfurtransferase [Succinivibrio dextrinosolvens]
MKIKCIFGIVLLAFTSFEVVSTEEQTSDRLEIHKMNSYTQITQEEAMQMMTRSDGHIILDVRRPDEYSRGHIPGAILIPNETIGATPPDELKDLNQIILVYCRSGNRSKQAAAKLAAMGYSQIYEFGGINTWTGEITQE